MLNNLQRRELPKVVPRPAENRNGVIKVFTDADRTYYTVEDVMQNLGIRRAKAYRMIKAVREEMIEAGYLTPEYPVGKIPKRYFDFRCGEKGV